MILALQFYEGDLDKAMRLAELLADIEKKPRSDVLLALVCQPGTPFDNRVKGVMKHCSKKFNVSHVVSKRGAKGWADGSGQLWTGTMEHFYDLWRRRLIPFDSIFTFDGGDGVPLHHNWIDLLKEEHLRTLLSGKLVTGMKLEKSGCYGFKLGRFNNHINGNMIMQLLIWEKYPSLHHTPLGARRRMCNTWDMYHADVFLAEASPSRVICSEWHKTGLCREILEDRAKVSVWLHGYKDSDATDIVRKYLLVSSPRKHARRKRPIVPIQVSDQTGSSFSVVTNPGCANPSDQAHGKGLSTNIIIG